MKLKRIAAFALALILVVSLFPAQALAEENVTAPTETTGATEETTVPTTEAATEPVPQSETDPSTEPSSEPTEPSGEATEPSTEATEPAKPSTEPTEPPAEATEPPIEATEPSVEATEPAEPTVPDTTEPSADCSCENTPERIVDHADACPRKIAVIALADSMTAMELHSAWNELTEVQHQDILDYLKSFDKSKYEELDQLLNPQEESTAIKSGSIQISEGGHVSAMWDASVFGGSDVMLFSSPMGYSLESEYAASDVIKERLGESTEILGLISTDITFINEDWEAVQPAEGKSVSLDFSIPNEDIPEGANKIVIVHICGDGTAEIVGEKYLDTDANVQSVLVRATGFSTYVTAMVSEKYQATLLRDALKDHPRYTVKSLYEVAGVKVNLFDYDPTLFNQGKTVDDSFVFVGLDGWSAKVNGGVNDSSAEYANQGILKEELTKAGIPVMAFGGKTTGGHLFDPYDMTGRTGRAAYPDVDFEFVYDKETRNYIYSSAHNHAQLADDNTKVELYTDTLAVINNANPVIALLKGDSSVNGAQDCELTFGNGQVTGKITNSNGGRADPYFNLNFEDFTANKKDKVVVRIKFNFNADGKQYWMYFNRNRNGSVEGAHDTRALIGTYTNGKNVNGWYEYEVVLDASENGLWTDMIANFRVDPIDESHGYVIGTDDQFVLESVSVIRGVETTLNSNLNAGFYPFSKIQDSYAGQGNQVGIDEWGTKITNAQGTDYQQGSRAIYNGTSTNKNIDHLYLGISAYLPFYIPESKQIDNKDIIYTFNGDDDLWVFIDGKLVLDIGGGHGMIKGTINFTTGEVEVSNAITVTGLTTGDYENPSPKTKTFTFEPGDHVMQFFYMERAGSISNCFMKFNFPLVPVSSLTVGKQVEKTSESELYLPDENEEFIFDIVATNPTHEEQSVDVDQWIYTIWGAGEEGLKTYSPVNGQIKLKRGQTARFEDVDEHTVVQVTERTPAQFSGSSEYVRTTVLVNNGTAGDGMATEVTTSANARQDIVFTNYYKDNFFDLTIIKEGSNEALDPYQTFLFTVKCEETGVDLDVVIEGNGQVTVRHLKAGTYTVTEDSGWSWRYVPDQDEAFVLLKGNQTVVFKNTRNEDKWLDGNSWSQNILDRDTAKTPNNCGGV